VLDVKVPVNETPKTPNLFAMYLDARTEKPDDSVEILIQKKREIEKMIEKLQSCQRTLRRKITLTQNKDNNDAQEDSKEKNSNA
jgi:hypothetical protein